MFGKGIDGTHVAKSLDPGIATPPEAGAEAGTRAPENRPAARASSPSAQLDVLPRRRTRAAPGTSASASRRASLPPQPAQISDAARIDAAKKTVDTARQYGKAWQALAGGPGQGVRDVEQGLTVAKQGLESAQSGLAALEEAREMGQEPPGGYAHAKAELIGYVLQAAEFGIVILHKQLEQWNQTGFVFGMPNPNPPVEAQSGLQAPDKHGAPESSRKSAGKGPSLETQAPLIGQALAEMSDKRGKLEAYEKIVLDFPAWLKTGGNHPFLQKHATKMKLSRKLAQSTMRGMNARMLELHIARLNVSGLRLGSIMERMGEDALKHIDDTPALRNAWDVIDQADDYDTHQLSNAKAVATRYLGGIDVLSEQLCFEAAVRIDMNDQSDLWQHAQDMADAFKTYASYLRSLCGEVRAGSSARPTDDTHAAAQAASSSRPQGASSREPEQAAGAPEKTQQPQGKAAAKQEAAAPKHVPAAPEPSTEAPVAAKRPPVNYREIAERVGGDVISIARELGKDTHALEQMKGSMFDPLDAAHFARTSVQSWLGDIGNLRKALSKARGASPQNEHRIAQLTNRLEALTLIHKSVATTEADALKRLTYPKAKHLRQLLKLNAIEGIDPPIRLDADGDAGDKGTVFEMRIRLKRLSDGERPRPMFLHLHTSKLVTCEAARTLPFKMLTAAHVKTDAQKNLGKKWEQMMGALGAVHRGKIDDPSLLGELRAFRPAA